MKLTTVKKVRNYAMGVEEGTKAFTAKKIADDKLESGVDYTPVECVVEIPASLEGLSEAEEKFFLKLISDQLLHHQGTTAHAAMVAEAKKKAKEAKSEDWLSFFENATIKLEVTAPRKATKAQEAKAVKLYEALVADKAVYDTLVKDAKLFNVTLPGYEDITEDDILEAILAKESATLL